MTARTRAELFLLSITLIWGSTFVVTKFILQNVSPYLYITIRFGLAALIFLLLFSKQIFLMKKETFIKGLILGSLLVVGFTLQTVGLQYTTASKSAFVTGMLVVFTPICQLLIERKPPKFGNILGVALVIAGLYFLTSPEGSAFNKGDALTLGCALTFALYIVYLDMFGGEHDSAQLTFMQFASSCVAGAILAIVGEDASLKVSTGFLLALGYLAVFATVIALYVQTRYQKDTTPTRSAIIFSIEPVVAAVFAYVTIGERIGLLGAVGGGLIVVGVVVSEVSDFLFNPAVVGEKK